MGGGAAAGALVLLLAGTWGPAIAGAGYTFDDNEGVLANPAINGAHSPLSAFGRDYWEHHGGAGHYRPLAQLSLALDHRIATALQAPSSSARVGSRCTSWSCCSRRSSGGS